MARKKKAAISNETPLPAFDAHVTAYWKNKLESLFSSPAEALAFSETLERLGSEKADALAALVAAALDANPDVIRAKPRALFNALYRLNDESYDLLDEPRRAKAEADAMTAFAETIEDHSPAVRRSQQNRKRQAEREAKWVRLADLIRAKVPAATAAVQAEWPDTRPSRGAVNREIADALEREGVNDGKRIGPRKIEQARKGR